jgi:RNA polymerase sigma factor (sigma-70 family)
VTLFRDRPELLPAFRRGERAALEAVYFAYAGRIESLIRGGWRGADGVRHPIATTADDVADLLQEVFARVFAERARLGFDGLRAFAPYLDTIARNLMVDWVRRRGRETPLDIAQLELVADEELAPDWADPSTMKLVEAYLAGLPDALRDVHRECYIRGRSQRDAAAALGMSRQQVRTLEARLRDGLRDALGKQEK